MKKSFALIVAALFALAACNPSSSKKEANSDWKTVGSKGFTLRLPADMKKAQNLNDDAVLQYQNPIKEFYCIVIEESVNDFARAMEESELSEEYPGNTIDGYAGFIHDRFVENMEDMKQSTEVKKISINGMNGTYFEATAAIDNVNIFYHFGTVQGDTTFYQVMTWTLASREERYKNDMMKVLTSFREK